MRSKTQYLFLLLYIVCAQLAAQAQSSTPLRRPISPQQPMWQVHIDTWNYPDPQKIIDLIPPDIRPFVVMNISLSISHDAPPDPPRFRVAEYGYEIARSWLRVCAENRMWVIVQPSSGGFSQFPDGDMKIFEEFYREYPNFIGFNYCEQFWGFNDTNDPLSADWTERVAHWSELLDLSARYGGYLTVSWCANQWSPSINPIAMLKRNPDFAEACRQHTKNFILCEKYTQVSYQSDMESLCLGAYLSGYSGQYGIRYDGTGWTDATGVNQNFTLATGGAAHLEHIMLTGQTVIDGPELIWTENFRETNRISTTNGFTTRNWETFPQFDNFSIDLFRKVLDGTVRIPTRQEVINRTKFVVSGDVNTGTPDAIFSSPDTLFEGLYRMDGDGNLRDNKTFFKKTGRYPTIPTVFALDDAPANSFQFKLNKSGLPSRWPTIAAKVAEFDSHFPQESTGDLYAGRHENGWVIYNPYKTGQTASGSIPFKYNTSDHVDLTLSQYTSGVMKESANQVTFYLTNFDEKAPTVLKTDTITIYGSATQPTWSFVDRANHLASIVTSDWTAGVFTLTVQHNGPLDITVNCSGSASERLTSYTPATLTPPTLPRPYTGHLQHEGENFDYKNISGLTTSGYSSSVRNYTGQGYARFGTSSSASVRDSVSVLKAGTYRLDTRYAVTGANVTSIDLYVNGSLVATPTFTQTPTLDDWAINKQNIALNAGANTIEYRAKATAAGAIHFDNFVVVPTVYGDGLVIQETSSGFVQVDGSIESNQSGFTDSGFADTTDAEGAGIDWALNFDASDVKSFTFRYSSTTDRTAELWVGGEKVSSGIVFRSTGSPGVWDHVTVYAYVEPGEATVRLQATSATGLPNVDSLEMIGATQWGPGTAPFTPQELAATPVSTSQIDLSWLTAPGADSYVVKRASVSGGPYTPVATGVTGTVFSDTGLSELTTYFYVVSAVNNIGNSEDCAETRATTQTTNPPAAPTGMAALAMSYHRIDLSWTGPPGAVSYIVKRSISNGGPYATIAIGATGTTFSDSNLFADTTYYYVVSAVNAIGEGTVSSQASAKTSATATLEPIADTYVRDGGSAAANFGTETTLVVKYDGGTGFNRNTFIKFDVSAIAAAQSAVLKLTPFQVDSGNAMNYELVTDDSWSETLMTWNGQPAGTGTVIASASGFVAGTQKSATITSAAVNEAAGDGILSLKLSKPIAGNNFVGFHSRETVGSGLRPVLECSLPYVSRPLPAAPTGLSAVASSPTRTDLSWTASPGASQYNLKRATDINGPYSLIAAGFTGLACNDSAVAEGVTYYYKVSALNGSGESADSAIASTILLGISIIENHSTGKFTAVPGGTAAGTLDLVDDTNVLVVGVYADTSGVTFPTTHTTFGGAVPDGVIQATGANRMTAFYWLDPNTAAGQPLVIDCNTTKESGYFALEVSGVNTSAAVTSTGATTTSGRSTSITTTNGNSFIVGFYSANGGGLTLTPQSPLTQVGSTLADINGIAGGGSLAAATMTLGTAGTQSLVWTQSGTAGEEGVNGFAFVPAAAALPPSAPTGLAAISVSASQINLLWTASPEAVGYNVKRSTTAGGSYVSIATGVTGTSYNDAGLSLGTSYHYVVTAVNPNGESENSAEANAAPQKLPATVAINNLTVTYDGSAKGITATTTPTGLTVDITYGGSPTPPVTPGTYQTNAVVNDINYQGSATGSLVISSRNFTDWELEKFNTQQILDGISATDADPDRDGLENLAEYALGSDPLSFTPQPTVSRTPNALSITFQRPAHIGDVAYFAETSNSMHTWDNLVLEVLNPGGDPETVNATKSITEPLAERLFIRLRFVK